MRQAQAATVRSLAVVEGRHVLAVLGAVAANYLPATRSRADRAAVIGKNRDPQFDLESAARGAGRNCNTRGVALRHAQEAARRRRQIWAASANRRLRHHHRQRLRLGTLDASRDQGRDVGVLREVYDGSWIRHIGSDGGRTLHWYGKVGLVSPALG